MKRIFALLSILLFIAGCGEQAATEAPVSEDKGTLDLFLSGNNVEDFQSIAVTISGFKAISGDKSSDISFASQEIELVKLKDSNVYELFQTALLAGNYDKLELSISKVVAYDKGAKEVIVKLDPIVLQKQLSVEKDKILEVVFDVMPSQSGDSYVLLSSAETSGVIGKDVTGISRKAKEEVKPVQVSQTESEKKAETVTTPETKPVEESKPEVVETPVAEEETMADQSDNESAETAKDILSKKEPVYVTLNGAIATPNPLTISVGDTIVFDNVGKSAQQVYSRSPYNYFRSERMITGDSFNFTFTEAGTYKWTSAPFVKYLDATITVS